MADATAWFPIVVDAYLTSTADTENPSRWWPAVVAAMRWLDHQDVTGTGLVSVAPSTDWMDAALTRSGRTLHMNVLYAWAEAATDRIAGAVGAEPRRTVGDRISRVNAWFWPDRSTTFDDLFPAGFSHGALRNEWERLAGEPRDHFLSHIVHAAFIDRCDVLANCLAVIAGVAAPHKAELTISALAPAATPWPSRTWLHEIQPPDGTGMLIGAVDSVIDPRWQNRPGRYHNAAAWPYVGGFHAWATALSGDMESAATMLERLAAVNQLGDWRFSEWIDGSGQPEGAPQQTWNAATYLLAHHAIQPTRSD